MRYNYLYMYVRMEATRPHLAAMDNTSTSEDDRAYYIDADPIDSMSEDELTKHCDSDKERLPATRGTEEGE